VVESCCIICYLCQFISAPLTCEPGGLADNGTSARCCSNLIYKKISYFGISSRVLAGKCPSLLSLGLCIHLHLAHGTFVTDILDCFPYNCWRIDGSLKIHESSQRFMEAILEAILMNTKLTNTFCTKTSHCFKV
jgi:hypothetical protein